MEPWMGLLLLVPWMGLWRSGPLQRAPPWLTKEPWMGLLLLVPGMERPEGPGPKGTSW